MERLRRFALWVVCKVILAFDVLRRRLDPPPDAPETVPAPVPADTGSDQRDRNT